MSEPATRKPYPITDAVREQRRLARTTHGARSEVQVRRIATVQKRRLLRQVGLRARDLDGLGLAMLDNWARAQAKVELMDAWSLVHGFLDGEGNTPPFVKVYFTALNSARLALGRLEAHLAKRPSDALSEYLATNYGPESDDG